MEEDQDFALFIENFGEASERASVPQSSALQAVPLLPLLPGSAGPCQAAFHADGRVVHLRAYNPLCLR